MPQSSRLKSAKAPSPRLFYSSRCRPWREGHARAHELKTTTSTTTRYSTTYETSPTTSITDTHQSQKRWTSHT